MSCPLKSVAAQEALVRVYPLLLERFGPQQWWPADSPFEVILGAILTQNTSWTNVVKALNQVKTTGDLGPARLRALSLEDLARLVRPSGYFNSKARKVKAFLDHLTWYQDDLDSLFSRPSAELRRELLSVHGIGEETADSILLYAGRLPFFVIDAYTRRVLSRLGLATGAEPYGRLQTMFQGAVPEDEAVYNEYHALLVRHGKEVCVKRAPCCGGCVLLELCPTGREETRGGRAPLAESTATGRQTGRESPGRKPGPAGPSRRRGGSGYAA